jgi:hypothetical protein
VLPAGHCFGVAGQDSVSRGGKCCYYVAAAEKYAIQVGFIILRLSVLNYY